MLQCPGGRSPTGARVSPNGLAGKLHSVFARGRSHLFDAHDKFLLTLTLAEGIFSGE